MNVPKPDSLGVAAAHVDHRLGEMFTHEQDRWRSVDHRLVEAIDELADLTRTGGKRLRAAFCYWSFVGANPSLAIQPAIDAAAACELLQTFALIHDDIMDDAPTRRGRETIHTRQAKLLTERGWSGEPRRYGEGVGILIGDLSHVYADRLIGDVTPETRQIWDELRIELNLGQYLDMRSSAAGDRDRETAERVVTFKSALYTIVRPLQLGASLAGRNDTILHDQLADFGTPIGIAFQLRDDLLGVLSTEAELGKPVGSDLREGKSTELLAIATEKASPSELGILATVGRSGLSEAEVDSIVEILHATGAVVAVEAKIAHLVDKSVQAAALLPYESEHRNILIELGRYVASRTY